MHFGKSAGYRNACAVESRAYYDEFLYFRRDAFFVQGNDLIFGWSGIFQMKLGGAVTARVKAVCVSLRSVDDSRAAEHIRNLFFVGDNAVCNERPIICVFPFASLGEKGDCRRKRCRGKKGDAEFECKIRRDESGEDETRDENAKQYKKSVYISVHICIFDVSRKIKRTRQNSVKPLIEHAI